MASELYKDTVRLLDDLDAWMDGLGVLAGDKGRPFVDALRDNAREAEDRHDQQVMLLERVVEDQEAA